MKFDIDISGTCDTDVPLPIGCAGGVDPNTPERLNRRIEMVAVDTIKKYKSNARTHSKQQIDQIAASIARFGFLGAVVIDEANQITAGHGRVEAAKRLGLAQVPALRVMHLSDAERRAYALVDNRLAELSRWDDEVLAIELQELGEIDFDLADIGFELADVDVAGSEVENTGAQTTARKSDRGATLSGRIVSRAGDLWRLGGHELRCADPGVGDSYAAIDAAIRRWQRVTGEPATLADSGKSFAAVTKERARTAKARAPRQAAGKRETA